MHDDCPHYKTKPKWRQKSVCLCLKRMATLCLAVLVSNLVTQCRVDLSHSSSQSIPCGLFILSWSCNAFPYEPVVDDPCLLHFQLGVVSHDLIQLRHAYPKSQAQAHNLSEGIQLTGYCFQIILICKNRLYAK